MAEAVTVLTHDEAVIALGLLFHSPMHQPGGQYWLSASNHEATIRHRNLSPSHSEATGPEYSAFYVSLVFDKDSHVNFAGFRLQIAIDERQMFQQRGWRLVDVCEVGPDHDYRRPLRYCRKIAQALPRPLCHAGITVVSPIHNYSPDNRTSFTLVCSVGELPQEPHCPIIYDSIHICSPGTTSAFILLQLKHSSSLFRYHPPPTHHPSQASIPRTFTRELHMIRIVPFNSPPTRHAAVLPTDILRRIVDFALDLAEPEWSGSLLEASAVQLPWRRLRDLFWERICGGSKRPCILHPLQVAQNMLTEPALRDHYTHLRLGTFFPKNPRPVLGQLEQPRPPDNDIAFLIQQIAENITVCDLDARLFHQNSLPRTRTVVQRLKRIERLSIDLGEPEPAGEMQPLQELIRGWRRLKHISIQNARHIPEMQLFSVSATEYAYRASRSSATDNKLPDPPVYRLTSLRITSSPMSGSQLLHFVPIATQMLRQVYLFQVIGLTNDDLKMFLSITCDTLSVLTIASCTIMFPIGQAEEPAVDAHISSMRKLRKLTVQDDLITAKTLSRGVTDSRDTGVYDFDIYPCVLTIWRISEDFLRQLPALVPSIRWDELVVSYFSPGSPSVYYGLERLRRTHDIAMKTGLPFKIISLPSEAKPEDFA